VRFHHLPFLSTGTALWRRRRHRLMPMPMSPEIAGGVAGEMALVFCVMFSAWMAIFMLAESVAGKLSSPDAASKRELDNVLRRCPPQRSAPRREPAAMQRTRLQLLEPEDGLGFQARPRARRASGGDPGLLQHGYGSPEAEPAAVQKARAKLLEPEDGLGFQARPRARRASRGDPGLLQHGYGSPEAEPAAVQKARAKLLEPEDSLGFQVAPRLLHQSRSDGDLQPYGRGSPIAPRTRSTSTTPLTSSPTTSQFSRKGSRPSTPQGRQRKAAPKSQISPGVRFLVSSLKQSQALQASRQSITPEVRDWHGGPCDTGLMVRSHRTLTY